MPEKNVDVSLPRHCRAVAKGSKGLTYLMVYGPVLRARKSHPGSPTEIAFQSRSIQVNRNRSSILGRILPLPGFGMRRSGVQRIFTPTSFAKGGNILKQLLLCMPFP